MGMRHLVFKLPEMLIHIFKSLHPTVKIKHLNTKLISSIPCSPLPPWRLSCAAFPLEVLVSLLLLAWDTPPLKQRPRAVCTLSFEVWLCQQMNRHKRTGAIKMAVMQNWKISAIVFAIGGIETFTQSPPVSKVLCTHRAELFQNKCTLVFVKHFSSTEQKVRGITIKSYITMLGHS